MIHTVENNLTCDIIIYLPHQPTQKRPLKNVTVINNITVLGGVEVPAWSHGLDVT